MGLQVIALLFLIGAIALGFAKKMNVGVVCLGLALILGKLVVWVPGISTKDFRISYLLHYWEPCCFSACFSRMAH